MRMRLETKFLRLKTPVTLGSRFGDWQVCWLGGWTRHRLSYFVMVVRAVDPENLARSCIVRREAGSLSERREVKCSFPPARLALPNE